MVEIEQTGKEIFKSVNADEINALEDIMELLVNGYISAVVGILSRLVAIETFRWVVEIPNSGFASNFELTSS